MNFNFGRRRAGHDLDERSIQCISFQIIVRIKIAGFFSTIFIFLNYALLKENLILNSNINLKNKLKNPHSLQEKCELFGKLCSEYTSSGHLIQIETHSIV